MKFNRKILIFIMFLGLVSLLAVYSSSIQEDIGLNSLSNNETDVGCCSIVLQLEGNHTIMSHRRDSNSTAEIFIENVDWHGHKAIKQYKTDKGYFCHAIITSDGWVIGFGGIDDGPNSEKIENITAEMINEDNIISAQSLEEIQKIKQPYGRGHVLIKAPNGNYGYATVDKIKTGKIVPGQYISLPNKYEFSRSGNITLSANDKIKVMDNLSRTDLYGVGRREIVIYDFQVDENNNKTDIYVSNEDGYYVGVNNSVFIDNIHINDTVVKGKDIPIAPNYEKIGFSTFDDGNNIFSSIFNLIKIIVCVVFLGIICFVVIRFIRYRRKYY